MSAQATALKPSEVLDRAADLIEPRRAWIRGDLARDARGFLRDPLEPEATCWCVAGAIVRAAGDPDMSPYRNAIVKRLEALVSPGALIWKWNDDEKRRKPQVVSALRKAAELARSEGQ